MVCARPNSSASESLSSALIGFQQFFVKPHVTVDHLAHAELGTGLSPRRLAQPAAPVAVGQQRGMACANAALSRGGTITPVSSSSCSRMPPTSVATTAAPQHMASSTTVDRHSPKLGDTTTAAVE